MTPSPLRVWLPALIALAVIVVWAWPRRTAPPLEEPPAVTTPISSLATPAGPPPPPQAAEVKAKMERLFGPVVEFAGGAFAAGDFNSDGWYDLAAVVRPRADRLSDLNHELASWIVQDPVAAAAAPPGKPPARPTLGADPVLAIVHGYDAMGWRSPDARQTYVLKGVAAARLEARPIAQAAAAAGLQVREDQTGDAIVEERGAERGFVYWNRARYAWSSLHPSPSRSPSPSVSASPSPSRSPLS